MKKILLLLISFMALTGYSQEKVAADSTKVKVKLTGFVNVQSFYDTRQIVSSRDNMLSLYALPAEYDENGVDLNDHGNFNQLSMTSRMRLNISGPKVIGAEPFAVIEGDFTGASNLENNSFRLREAYIKLKWEKISVLAGQTWHPINSIECRPFTLGLNTGGPFHPFSRANQINIEYHSNGLSITAAALSQRDYTSFGPMGATSTYLQRGIIPNLNMQIKYKTGNVLFGGGIDYKSIKPELSHSFNGKTYLNESNVEGWSYNAFFKYSNSGWEIKAAAIYGENLTDQVMLGGYYESRIDTASHILEYAPSAIVSSWIQLTKNWNRWSFSLFGGYCKSLEYDVEKKGEFYGRGNNIEMLYRILPQVTYQVGALQLGFNVEYTVSRYADVDTMGRFSNGKDYANTRYLLNVLYFF